MKAEQVLQVAQEPEITKGRCFPGVLKCCTTRLTVVPGSERCFVAVLIVQ